MRGWITIALSLVLIGLGLVACSGITYQSVATRRPSYPVAHPTPKGGGRYVVGKPYFTHGRWYYPATNPGYNRVGTASWYGAKFHGRRTANGEVYDMRRLTAAHPTLPLPSYLEVINLNNGRSLLVRANDRGPFISGRIVDLSARAAELLGFKHAGTTRVRVRYLGPAPLNGNDARELAYARQRRR